MTCSAADQGDAATLPQTLNVATHNLAAIDLAPTPDALCEVIADKGHHSRDGLKALESSVWKTRIAEPQPAKGYWRWHGDEGMPRTHDQQWAFGAA